MLAIFFFLSNHDIFHGNLFERNLSLTVEMFKGDRVFVSKLCTVAWQASEARAKTPRAATPDEFKNAIYGQ